MNNQYTNITDSSMTTITENEDSDNNINDKNHSSNNIDIRNNKKRKIQELHTKIIQQRNRQRKELLRQCLAESRDKVLSSEQNQKNKPNQRIFPRLPSNNEGKDDDKKHADCAIKENNHEHNTNTTESHAEAAAEKEDVSISPPPKPIHVKFRNSCSFLRYQKPIAMPPIYLEGGLPTNPLSTATVFLQTCYVVEDQPNLTYVPFFGDDDREDVVSEVFNIAHRESRLKVGAEYREKETNEVMDEIIALLRDEGEDEADMRILANVMSVDEERVLKRYSKLKAKDDTNAKVAAATKSSNSDSKKVLEYENTMDSYRGLFCRRCFKYDCNMHGNVAKPGLDLQTDLALTKQRDGIWDEHPQIIPPNVSHQPSNSNQKELTVLQKSILSHSFSIFQNSIPSVSNALGCPPNLITEQAIQDNLLSNSASSIHTPPTTSLVRPPNKKQKFVFSMKNYNPNWLKNVEKPDALTTFNPCAHPETCDENNCHCVQNAHFCTKHCCYSTFSRNFFRGCACKQGQCRTKSCSCYAASRECDPDLCKTCGAGYDAPGLPATQQRCRNDNIGMRRHVHLLLGKSEIAGWGIFTKFALKRGDYIHEYIGEIISQEEAERRGRVYDKVNRSYLFNLSSDCVVDASRKGNKTKFANHSSKPNMVTKMFFVNGDIRIGMFAKEDVEPQSELCFDYRYDVGIDNQLIKKPGVTVEWMKNPKMASKISKKYT